MLPGNTTDDKQMEAKVVTLTVQHLIVEHLLQYTFFIDCYLTFI